MMISLGKTWHFRTALAATTLSLISCAVLGGAEPASSPTDSAGDLGSVPPTATKLQEAATTASRVCEDPPPQEVALGATITSSIGEPDWTNCYWLDVPPGLTSITFSMTGLEADLSLFAGYGYLAPIQYHIMEFWDSTEAETADESISLQNPKAGPYFLRVGIAGPKDPSPYTLTVMADPPMTSSITGVSLPGLDSCGGPAQVLALGASATGEIPAHDERPLAYEYYCVEVPAGTSSFTVELADMTGFLELFVRRHTPVDWADRTRADDLMIVVENPEPGAYYIDVTAALVGASSPYTLTVSGP